MKETGSKPLKREDLDSDVSLIPMLQCLVNNCNLCGNLIYLVLFGVKVNIKVRANP